MSIKTLLVVLFSAFMHCLNAQQPFFKNYQINEGLLSNYVYSVFQDSYEGFVSFQSKTKLIEHYELSLGATHVGGHKMVIFPAAALKLIKQYFKT